MTDTATPPSTDPAADTAPAPTADLIPAASAEPGWRVVARTIIRGDQDLDIRPLYINGLSSFGGAASDSRQSGSADDVDVESNVRGKGAAKNQYDDTVGEAVESVSGFGSITDDGATAEPERRLTFGSYFNAFPASYWRRWTDIRTVRLTATVSGSGTLLVYRSTAKGHVQRADSVSVEQVDHDTLVVDLSLQNFIDGGWYWFDIEAGDEPFTLHNAHWSVETDRDEPGTVSIGITTFNRPDFCVDQLVKLAQQPAVLEILDEVIVVDQGNQKVRDHTLFEQASKALGSKLRYIEQGNLGGSGGFSRSMDEATVKGSADYVLLLDDDVVCEPEGILRAVTFADLTKQPMLVGGQMFSLYDRTVMHAYGEAVARWRWFWGPAPKTKHGHNFAQRSLRSTKWLHRRVDVDYNGWWMCLIPTDVIRQVGLSLPMFIKWDDAEFGLRAAEAGFQTATLPGVAVWHVPWHEKDDTIDWQAYFHRRNRIVAALLHTPYERGGRLIQESFETQVKHVLSMQYAPAEMGLMAIEDILDGPERMHRDLRMRLGELNALRKQYDDSIAKADLDQFPTARRKKPPRRGKGPGTPVGLVARAKTMALSGIRQALPVRELSQSHPEANVPHVDLKWWLLAQYDSALVSSADGTSASWYKRDPKKARDLMSRSVALHVRLAKEWPELAQTYKDALPELASPKTWAATFEDSLDDGRSPAAKPQGSAQ